MCLSVPFVCMCCQMYSSALARQHGCICAFTQHLERVLSQQCDRVTGAGKWVSHALSRHEGDRRVDGWMDGWMGEDEVDVCSSRGVAEGRK